MNSAAKPSLVFLADFPFSERDSHRFGIATLSTQFDVKVFDLSNLTHPESLSIRTLPRINDPILQTFFNIDEVVDELCRIEPQVAISNLGLSSIRHRVIICLRELGTPIVEFRLGTTPGDSVSEVPFLRRIRNRLKQTTGLRNFVRLAHRKLFVREIYHDPPDIVVVGGKKAHDGVAGNARKIVSHSLDFDRYRQEMSSNPPPVIDRPYAIYLDQVMGFHIDYEISDLRIPIKPDVFYRDLIAYFERFSESTGLTVVACPHPRAPTAFLRTRLKGIEITSEPAVRAIANASCVLGHNSTAFSYAVLWKKPAVLLANKRLMKSWEGPFVTNLAEALGTKIDLIDKTDTPLAPTFDPYSEPHYEKYVWEYLSEISNDKRDTWSIVRDELITLKSQ